VIAGLHIDLRLRLDAVVHDEGQRVTVTKGRNSSVRAIREQRIDLGFLGHFNIIAKLVPQIRKAEGDATWNDGEHIAGIAPEHDALAKRSPEIRHASAVRADDMVGSCGITSYWMFSAVKLSLECGSYGHDGPPLRLTSLASLALTAPGKREAGKSAA